MEKDGISQGDDSEMMERKSEWESDVDTHMVCNRR